MQQTAHHTVNDSFAFAPFSSLKNASILFSVLFVAISVHRTFALSISVRYVSTFRTSFIYFLSHSTMTHPNSLSQICTTHQKRKLHKTKQQAVLGKSDNNTEISFQLFLRIRKTKTGRTRMAFTILDSVREKVLLLPIRSMRQRMYRFLSLIRIV